MLGSLHVCPRSAWRKPFEWRERQASWRRKKEQGSNTKDGSRSRTNCSRNLRTTLDSAQDSSQCAGFSRAGAEPDALALSIRSHVTLSDERGGGWWSQTKFSGFSYYLNFLGQIQPNFKLVSIISSFHSSRTIPTRRSVCSSSLAFAYEVWPPPFPSQHLYRA